MRPRMTELLMVVCLGIFTVGAQAQDKSEQDTKAALADAEQRLEAAAREVAELAQKLAPRDAQVLRQQIQLGGRPKLGLSLAADRLNPRPDVPGIPILGVAPGSPAADAGIGAGDVLLAVGSESMRDLPTAAAIDRIAVALDALEVEEAIDVRVSQGGAERVVSVVPRPEQEAEFFAFEFGGPDAVASDGFIQAWASEGGAQVFNAIGPDSFVFVSSRSPWSSMEMVELSPRLARYFDTDGGLLIVRAPSDPSLGFEDGDVIRDIGGREPNDVGHAMRILRSYQAGEPLAVTVVRDGRRRSLEIDVPEWSDAMPIPPSPVAPPPAPGPSQ